MFAITVVDGEGGRRYVFCDPGGISKTPIKGGDKCISCCEVGDWAWETILEEPRWVDWRDSGFGDCLRADIGIGSWY